MRYRRSCSKIRKSHKMATESELIAALRHAVDGEKRFGIREDCKVDVEARWSHVVALIARLIAEVKRKK